MAGIDQRAERRHGEFGSTEKRELHRGPYRQPSAGELGMRRQWTRTLDQRPLDHRQGTGRQSRRPPRCRRSPSRSGAGTGRPAPAGRSTTGWRPRRRSIGETRPRWRARPGARAQAARRAARALHLGTGWRGKSMLMDLFSPTRRWPNDACTSTSSCSKSRRGCGPRGSRAKARRRKPTPSCRSRARSRSDATALLRRVPGHQHRRRDDPGPLFETLFSEGITVIATSNRKPTISTRTALQRDRFLPFIDLIKQRLEILELGGRRLPPGSAAQLRCLPDAGGAS